MRHILSEFRLGHIKADKACAELSLSRSRFYELYADYLSAGPQRDQNFIPATSGGNHAKEWPVAVLALLRQRLKSKPASSYSFAASEALRLYGFKIDRAQVRRWAIQNHVAHPASAPKAPAVIRRWQRSQIGELWQLDASPHQYFPSSPKAFPMLNLIDDCSRVLTGSKIYPREVLTAYLDLLSEAFTTYGLPLVLYVDYHSMFFTNTPEALTHLGKALHFYGITFRYTPTAEAKGKVGAPPSILAESFTGLLRRRTSQNSQSCQHPHLPTAPSSQPQGNASRTENDSPDSLGSGPKTKALRPAPQTRLPLVAFRVERALLGSGQCSRPGSRRHPLRSRRMRSRHSAGPLLPHLRSPLHSRRPPKSQHSTCYPFLRRSRLALCPVLKTTCPVLPTTTP